MWKTIPALIKRYSWVTPWFSFSWGVISGVLISRDYSHWGKLLGFSVGLVLCSFAVGFWFLWYQKRQNQECELKGLSKHLVAKAAWIEWTVLAVTQMYVQYILMFSLTFLFFAKAWLFLGLTLLVSISTLWDPWWQRLMKHQWYECLVRLLGSVLAASFLFVVFFPEAVKYYYLVVGAVASVCAFPFMSVTKWKKRLVDFLPFGACVATEIFCLVFGVHIVPVLSIWLYKPEVGMGVHDRQLEHPIEGSISKSKLTDYLQGGGQVCCFTPIVAPRVLQTSVVHEWFLNGSSLERLSLPKIRGLDNQHAFRTWSCKKSFPGIENVENISCHVYLNGDIFIGKVSLDVSKE